MKNFNFKKNLKVIVLGIFVLAFVLYSIITADIKPADNKPINNSSTVTTSTDNTTPNDKNDKKTLKKENKKIKKKTARTKTSNKKSQNKNSSAKKPVPRSHHKSVVDTSKKHTCYVSIDCLTVFDNWDKLKNSKKDIIPKNGYMLSSIKITFNEGESAYDVLLRVAKNKGLHLDTQYTAAYNSAYIRGIGNLYEKDCGPGSGWSYKVNGWSPNYGCSRYTLKEGDTIQFRYSCKTGNDI